MGNPAPRKVDRPLVLYGYGALGKLSAEIFDRLKIPYEVCDVKYENLGLLTNKLIAVCIATIPYEDIVQFLEPHAAGSDIVPVWDIVEAYPELNIHNGWFSGPVWELETIWEKVEHVLYKLADMRSKHHYLMMADWRLFRIEIQPMTHPVTLHDRFLIPEIVDILTPDEVYSDGENIYDKCPPPDGLTYKDLCDRRKIMKMTTPATYIKLHLEGGEYPTLRTSIKYLYSYRPILAITTYHSQDGLWKIPHFLMTHLPDYEFLFRCHAYMGQGTVLYCIPNERRANAREKED